MFHCYIVNKNMLAFVPNPSITRACCLCLCSGPMTDHINSVPMHWLSMWIRLCDSRELGGSRNIDMFLCEVGVVSGSTQIWGLWGYVLEGSGELRCIDRHHGLYSIPNLIKTPHSPVNSDGMWMCNAYCCGISPNCTSELYQWEAIYAGYNNEYYMACYIQMSNTITKETIIHAVVYYCPLCVWPIISHHSTSEWYTCGMQHQISYGLVSSKDQYVCIRINVAQAHIRRDL